MTFRPQKASKAEEEPVGQDQEGVGTICSRFVPQLPEHGPKHECNANSKGESSGVVGRGAPEGDDELPDDDEVLLPEVAGVLGVKVQGGHPRVGCADLCYQPLLLPAGAHHTHFKGQAQVGHGACGGGGGGGGGGCGAGGGRGEGGGGWGWGMGAKGGRQARGGGEEGGGAGERRKGGDRVKGQDTVKGTGLTAGQLSSSQRAEKPVRVY